MGKRSAGQPVVAESYSTRGWCEAPKVSAESTKPEDVREWSDYYAECEEAVELSKPCMGRSW